MSMTVIYGRSGCGKTAVAVDMACRVATGLPWRGRQVQQGIVLYIAAENAESTRRRVWAWGQRFQKGKPLPVAVVHSPVIMDGKVVDNLLELIRAVEEELGQKVVLVAFDTLARTMKGDENSAADMGAYIQCLDQLKDLGKVHVLAVHHTGKNEERGARGSSALKAAADHEIEVEKGVGTRIGAIRLTKVREGDLEGERYGFELMPRVIGPNRLGRDVTTVVCEECDAPALKVASKRCEDKERVLGFIREHQGPLTEKGLRTAIRLREGDNPNRQAWHMLRKTGVFLEDDAGFVFAGE